MNESTSAALPEIPEDAAADSTADIYAALRRTSGAALVPLIYRHLATFPQGLDWAWSVFGPFMETGELPARASRVVDMAVTGDLSGLRQPVSQLGLSPAELGGIAQVLDLYNRTNPINIIAVKLTRFVLSVQPPDAAAPEIATPPEALTLSNIPAPPPIIGLDAMPQSLVALVEQLSSPGSTAGDRIVPGLYRHLANWPPYLVLAAKALIPHYQTGAIAEAATRVRAHADAEAAGAWTQRDLTKLSQNAPTGETRTQMIASLDAFVARIPEMVVVGSLLRSGLPGSD